MLRFSSRSFYPGASLAIVFVCLTGAHAQTWKQIGNFPAMNFRCAYFWDTAHGVVAGDNHIFRYNSGTWTESTYPETPSVFHSLRLLDRKNLYAASGSSCVWKSTDSGASWELTTSKLIADDIYLDANGTIQGVNLPGIGMMAGTTYGTSGTFCAIARDDSVNNLYSTDGGNTWLPTDHADEPWGYCLAVDPCANIFYALTDAIKIELWKSLDGGKTWQMIHDFVTSAVDVLEGGSNGVLYVQETDGIFRSIDGGLTFSFIGGPASVIGDRRMFAFGNGNRSLIALNAGEVWQWDDSVPRQRQSHKLQAFYRPPDTIPLCDSVLIPMIVSSSVCSGVDSLAVMEFESNPFLRLDSGRSTLGRAGTFDTVWFEYVPKQLGTTSYSIRIHGLFSDGTPFDTVLTSILSATSAGEPSISYRPGTMPSCSMLRLPVIVKAPRCGNWRIDSIGKGFPLIGQPEAYDSILAPNALDTIWFDFNLFEPGKHTMFAELYLSTHDLGLRFDTLITLSVSVGSDNVVPRVSAASSLTVANCTESIIPFVIQALPCDSVSFTSCTLTLDKSLKYTTNFSFPITLAAGEADTLLLDFPAQNLNGAYIVSAHLIGKYLGSSLTFDTTIQIRVIFTSSPGALAANDASIDFDTINVCEVTDTVVIFKNLGCDSITVTGDGTVWQPGWSADDPSFPFKLAPDSSFSVHVHFRPSEPTWSEQFISYAFDDIGGKAGTNLPFAITATAISAPSTLSLSDTALNFGTFARCNASSDTLVTLTNSGCDSLALSGASVGAGSGFSLVEGMDTVLAPNQSAQYRIQFSDSIAGNLFSALHIHAVGAHGGNTFDTSIALRATIIPGSHVATLRTRAIDFGITSICEERDSTIAISNIGCEWDTITRARLLSAQFLLDTTFPIVLQPGKTVIIPISTNLDSNGHPIDIVDTLVLISNVDSALPPVVLSRGVVYPERFSLGLKSEDSAAIGAKVPVYVLRNGTIPNSSDEMDFDLLYNEDLLGYVNVIQPDIQMINTALLPSGLTDRSFAMKPGTDRDTIATLEFQSYLAKQQHTPITLANEKFMAGRAISPPCVASIDSGTGAGFTLELACGDGTIANALTGLPIDFVSINVSPEVLGFTLHRSDATIASCSAEVLTVLGARMLGKQFDLGQLTSSSFDLHALPAGAYFLRISAGRSVITRRFVNVK